MDGLLGKKVGMTQIFSKKGDCVPVTVIQVERCVPILRRTREEDGYDAVLVGYGDRKPKHTTKPLKGFYDKVNVPPARILAEFRGQEVDDEGMGKPIMVDIFNEGDRVSVIGISKGKGFAGVVKRYGFAGLPGSRGAAEAPRGGGSVGMHTYPGRVFKGKKMPGHMGAKKVHTKNLEIVRLDKEKNVLFIKGAVPGGNGQVVRIVKAKGKK